VVDPDESLLARLPSRGAQAAEGLPSTSSPRSYNSGSFQPSVADPDCQAQIRIFPSRIPDPHQLIMVFFTKKTVSKLSEKLFGISSQIPDPGGQQSTGPRYRIRICNTVSTSAVDLDPYWI
jgi:hypothetical protein